MPTTTAKLPLRKVDRDRLLRLLGKLGDSDPDRRAKYALDAAELLRRKGRSWTSLIPIEYGQDAPEPDAYDWRAIYDEMLQHPEVTLAERVRIRRIQGWRAPGAAETEWLESIGDRIGLWDVQS